MTRGTHSAVERAPVVGDAVGRYRIIGVLGDGRLGRLYVAEQSEIRGVSKTVALRCVRPELARSPAFRARFQEAARIAARAEHPNVVTVFELGSVEDRYFISMEYLPGENVASILRRCNTREAVPPDTAAYVVKQAAIGLQYLHELREGSPQRVSTRHDEVDPSNVFVSYHGTVKYLGFGLRSLAQESGMIDAVSTPAVSTPGGSGAAGAASAAPGDRPASSPASGARATAAHDGDAERRADVLRLGVFLLTCLGGARPALASVGEGDAALDGEAAPARQAAGAGPRTDLPEALDAILKRALSPDPQQRFESPRAMAEALDRYLFQRDSRPTPKHLRRWMEQLFDSERASLQMQIARGRDVEAALSHLLPAQLGGAPAAGSYGRAARPFSSPRPRELWSTGHAIFSPLSRASFVPRSFERVVGVPDESRVTAIPLRHRTSTYGTPAPTTLASAELPPVPPAPQRTPGKGWAVAAALSAVAAVAALVMLFEARGAAPVEPAVSSAASTADRSGRVDVQSRPEGAAVFVDGEPTGLRTPAVLKGLAPGRTIRVRVEKAGYKSEEQTLEVVAGSPVTQVFELHASAGRVQFAGAPPEARVFVDDVPIAHDGAPVNLPIGPHGVRVETPNALLFSGTVDVVAGEQTIQVGGEPRP